MILIKTTIEKKLYKRKKNYKEKMTTKKRKKK